MTAKSRMQRFLEAVAVGKANDEQITDRSVFESSRSTNRNVEQLRRPKSFEGIHQNIKFLKFREIYHVLRIFFQKNSKVSMYFKPK